MGLFKARHLRFLCRSLFKPMPRPPLRTPPPDLVSLEDYERLARERCEEPLWAYLTGGAADEWSLRENREAFARIPLRPRLLRDLEGAHTRLQLFGCELAHPLLVAPTAWHRLFHPEGELATVLGASAMEASMVVSTSATTFVEDIAAQATSPLWFQLYIQPDRDFTLDLIRRVEAAGYRALVVTADAPLDGFRNRERRAGFRLPEGMEAVNLQGMRRCGPADRVFGSELLRLAPTWRDLAWLRSQTRLPILLKGLLHPGDVSAALEAGVDGIVVSNHGGRVLDTVPASIEALPGIVEAVAGRVPVLMDGGIRRGTDVYKALARGAAAVMIGRPVLHGLIVAGAVGVSHVLKILRTELELTMAMTGCRTLSDIPTSGVCE